MGQNASVFQPISQQPRSNPTLDLCDLLGADYDPDELQGLEKLPPIGKAFPDSSKSFLVAI